MSDETTCEALIPEFQEAIQRLLASEKISEELKLVAIKKVREIVDRHIKEVQ